MWTRNSLLIKLQTLLLFMCACYSSFAEEALRHEHIDLSNNWLFQFTLTPSTALVSDAWENVSIPHTWNADDGSQVEKNYRRGIGIYQRTIKIPKEWQGRSIFLTVGAANAKASISVNGQFVLEHITGFTAFTAPITTYVNFEQDNTLVITVDNSPSADYPPLISDYTFFGGIYRDVYLTTTKPVHVSLTHYSSSGIYLEQVEVTNDKARVNAHVEVANDFAYGIKDVHAEITILHPDGSIITTQHSDNIEMGPQSGQRVTVPIEIKRPHLWHGRSDPFIYRARVRIFHDQLLMDEIEQPLGLRYFSVSPEHGFFLNGKPYDLHGVALHQDRKDKGWAINGSDREEDVNLIKELGATYVRLVHYPHSPETVSLLDKAGIVTWSEIPIAYRIGRMPIYQDNCKRMLEEMIHQLYNHPSICFWGLFNEISGTQKQHIHFIKALNDAAKASDPTRLTTAAAGSLENDPIVDIPDVIAFNRYFGWYIPNANLFAPWAESVRTLYPDRRFGLAEFGADGDVERHADRRTTVEKLAVFDMRKGTEEYQAHLHEQAWLQIKDRPFIWCKTIWNFADWSRGGIRTPTIFPSAGIGRKGLVTHDRKIRKDAFYWYKANWSAEPVLHICERRFTNREYREIDLRIYCNINADVTVHINKKPLTVNPERMGVRYLWPSLVLSPGLNTITVEAQHRGKTITDTVTWDLPDKLPVGSVDTNTVKDPPIDPDPGF